MHRTFVLLGLLTIGPFGGLAAQEPETGAGPSFLLFRYASRSALAIYGGYTAGPALLVVGMLQNPRSSYREIMGGVGKAFVGRSGNGITVAPAIAWSNTGWYAQLYLVPAVRVDRVSLSGTVQLGEPLDRRGVRAAYVSPANVLVDIGAGLAVGAGYYGSFEAGSVSGHSAGPAFRRAIPHGSVTLELVRDLRLARDELRLTVQSSF